MSRDVPDFIGVRGKKYYMLRSFWHRCAARRRRVAGGCLAQGATVTSPVELARQAAALKPGQWVWAPKIAPAGPVLVYVDLSTQTADVYRNGVRIAVDHGLDRQARPRDPDRRVPHPAKGSEPPFEQV